MTSTILKKMKEKEKRPDRKSGGGQDKNMRRNRTTVNFHRSKTEKTDKPDEKSRKSVGPKRTKEDKSMKSSSTIVKTEGNEKKKPLMKSASKKDVLSKTEKKPSLAK